MDEVVQATHRMLDWRQQSWVPKSRDWCDSHPALGPLLPTDVACAGAVLHIGAEKLLILITDAVRLTTSSIKAALVANSCFFCSVLKTAGGIAIRRHYMHQGIFQPQKYTLAPLQLVAQCTVSHTLMDQVRLIPWYVVLMYPLDHQLVPVHRKATAEDLKLLPRGTLSRRNLLPAIRSDDIIVQYLGLHVNDIVRIDRHDGTVYFRAVIANLR